MPVPDNGNRIARILVALDHSDDSRATLAEAVALAARLQAEIVGLFIEDAKIFEAAQLPFVRQISLTGHAAPIDPGDIARSLRVQAQSARQLLGALAERHRLAWSFQVARGRASVEILNQAQPSDLVIVGKTAPAATRQGRIGATALAVATALRGAVLFSEPRASHVLGYGGPVLAIYDGQPVAERVLAIAARLAAAGGQALVVVVPGAAAARTPLRHRAEALLAGRDVRFIGVESEGAAALEDVLAREGIGLIVIGERAPLLAGAPLPDLLGQLSAPLLVVGG